MEFKHLYKMTWLYFIWFTSFYSLTYGDKRDYPVAKAEDKTKEGGSFPFDLQAASSSSMQQVNPPKMKLDEDKKTLSQQIADGKYGLIQKELFSKPVPRPGVISYDNNSEVPKDNMNNLGGLNKSEIWLAENHLLVLKGGVLPLLDSLPEYSKPIWSPIDDYDAPRRQVKLPKNPKVPPPFPVQLTDGGPLQILGTNFTRTLNDSFFPPPYAIPPLEGYDTENGPLFPPSHPLQANSTSRKAPFPIPPYPPPIQEDSQRDGPLSQPPFPINGALPPFFDSLPPGSAILPPPNNGSDQLDEDDLSIYYPPPYSFYYPRDNTTQVPPGPLVPGIVLPPPPDFFEIIQPSTTTEKVEPTTTSKPVVTLTTTYPTTTSPESVTNRFINTIPQTSKNKTINVTILRLIPTRKPPIYIYDNNVSNKPFPVYGPPPTPTRYRGKIKITTTKVPLRAYFTTSNEVDKNLVTKIPNIQQYTTRENQQKVRTKPRPQIYHYDDSPITNTISTPYSVIQPNRYINLTKAYYPGSEKQKQFVQLQPQYIYIPHKAYLTERPQNNKIIQPSLSQNNYKTHIIKLQEQLQLYQRPPKQYTDTIYNLQNTRPIYKQNLYEYQPPARPSYKENAVQPQQNQPLQTLIPIQTNQGISSAKPLYQYSFEVANYKEQHDKLQTHPVPQYNIRQSKVRNLPKYTVQVESALELTTTEHPGYKDTPPTVYYEQNNNKQKYYTSKNPQYNQQRHPSTRTNPRPIEGQTYTVTPNPLYQTYYTKQDEQYLDDLTKNYFTTFGKKISTSTTPIPTPTVTDHTEIIYSQPNSNLRFKTNRPTYSSHSSLHNDIVVNYVNNRQPQNVHSEFVQLNQQPPYPQVSKQVPHYSQPFLGQVRQKAPNANVQTIQAISVPSQGDGRPGSFISYELPGDDGAHFYFLTPQLRQKSTQDDVSYYYTPQTNPRINRNY